MVHVCIVALKWATCRAHYAAVATNCYREIHKTPAKGFVPEISQDVLLLRRNPAILWKDIKKCTHVANLVIRWPSLGKWPIFGCSVRNMTHAIRQNTRNNSKVGRSKSLPRCSTPLWFRILRAIDPGIVNSRYGSRRKSILPNIQLLRASALRRT